MEIVKLEHLENLSSIEHLELNRELGVHGAYDKGLNHLRREWIMLQRKISCNEGTNHHTGRIEHL